MVVIQLALGDDTATGEAAESVLYTDAVTVAVSELLPEDAVAVMAELNFDVDFDEGAMLITVLHLVLDVVLFLVETALMVVVLHLDVTAPDTT